jgi:hypothetical protein
MEVKDYPNYLIYSDGRVWSKKSNKFIKHRLNGTGYHRVGLYNPKRKNLSVHKLVAEHYIPNPDNKPEADHIDRDIDNNDVSNLRWVTHRENCENRGEHKKSSRNTSGHKNIFFRQQRQTWIYQQEEPFVRRSFKSKTDAICFKFICRLKRNSS